jgi:hypothetical protein
MGREQPISGRVELGAHGIMPNYFEQNQVRDRHHHAPCWLLACCRDPITTMPSASYHQASAHTGLVVCWFVVSFDEMDRAVAWSQVQRRS